MAHLGASQRSSMFVIIFIESLRHVLFLCTLVLREDVRLSVPQRPCCREVMLREDLRLRHSVCQRTFIQRLDPSRESLKTCCHRPTLVGLVLAETYRTHGTRKRISKTRGVVWLTRGNSLSPFTTKSLFQLGAARVGCRNYTQGGTLA